MRVAVTGASGFVGRAVVAELSLRGIEVLALTRTPPAGGASPATASALARDSDGEDALAGVLAGSDALVHLAAKVHDVRGRTSEAEYFAVNRDYTLRLARAAARAGVSRFVFLSTIKVNGEASSREQAFGEASPARPEGAYALSKYQAEQGLCALEGSLLCSIVRCPLVYGPGVRANFARLLGAVERGWPLPFGAVNNRRSLLYVGNLAHALVELSLPRAGAPRARTYLVADGEDLSTPELVRRIATALEVPPRLLYVPEPLLRFALRAVGKSGALPRLLGSLRVDASRLRQELGWAPPWSVDQGLAKTAAWFRERP